MSHEQSLMSETMLYKPAEKFIGNSLSVVLHNYPYLFPYMRELEAFDRETFKHSVCVAETAVRIFTKYALSAHLPEEQLQKGIVTLSLGGYLHDVGKAGINKYSLKDSSDILHSDEKQTQSVILVAGHDTRSDDDRAVIHNHPTIGGYMIRNLCKQLPIPKDIAMSVSEFAFNHHEKPNDLSQTHNSYSRSSTLRMSPMDTLLHTILTLSDVAVAMREPRSYRNNESLPWSVINNELLAELSDDLMHGIFGSNQNIIKLREILCGYAMSTVQEIDPVLSQEKYDLDGTRINGFVWYSLPADRTVLIPELVSEVWDNPKYERRFLNSLDREGGKKWKHISRS